MDAQSFQHLLARLDRLTIKQKSIVQHFLQINAQQDGFEELIPDLKTCPHCATDAAHLASWGCSGGLQRYRCKACRRTCNALTGTPLARRRKKDCWLDYGQALIAGLTVRAAARHCSVSKNTSFRWRHRFLHDAAAHHDTRESGIVEATKRSFSSHSKAGGRCRAHPVTRGRGQATRNGAGPDSGVGCSRQ